MPVRTIPDTDIQYSLISFDGDGVERSDDPDTPGGRFSDNVVADAAAQRPTDVFLFSHGWKGDLPGAVEQYNRWIKVMATSQADRDRMGTGFRPLWIGLHWPSKPLGQEKFEEDFADVETDPDTLKREAVQQMGDTPEVRECLDIVFQEHENNAAALTMPPHVVDAYRKLAEAVGYTAEGPAGPPDADGVAFDPEKAFEAYGDSEDFAGGGFFGKLLSPLVQLSYWRMKYRARKIGEGGMHDFVARLQNALPAARFHLMGHSFGCIVVSSILSGKGGNKPLPRPVDSLALVQGAVSLWSFADKVKNSDKPGYYNGAFHRPAVRGPIIVTRSAKDNAIRKAYPLASALLPFLGNDFADDSLTPTDLPHFGGIGMFGLRGLEVGDLKMLPAAAPYDFKAGKIYNLQSDDFIPDHSGIDGPEVAHAIWQVVIASTKGQNGQFISARH